jgi:hypothetical protein
MVQYSAEKDVYVSDVWKSEASDRGRKNGRDRAGVQSMVRYLAPASDDTSSSGGNCCDDDAEEALTPPRFDWAG